jgi:hypothetical protein
VPDDPLVTAVIEHAQRLSEPYLFNHAMRSWLFAEAITPSLRFTKSLKWRSARWASD